MSDDESGDRTGPRRWDGDKLREVAPTAFDVMSENPRPIGAGANSFPVVGADRDVFTGELGGTTARSFKGPGRALQFHLDLFDRVSALNNWSKANAGRPLTKDSMPFGILQRARLLSTHFYDNPKDALAGVWNEDLLSNAAAGLSAELEDLGLAETHYVSHSVMESVTIAAESADPEPLFDTDLPCPNGLIVFEYPLMIADVTEEGDWDETLKVPIRAIAWAQHLVTKQHDDGTSTMGMGIRYVLYNSYDSYDFKGSTSPDGTEMSSEVLAGTKELGSWVVDFSGWSFGSPWGDGGWNNWRELPEGEVHSSSAQIRRWLLAYFRWTWTRIIVPTIHRPSRAERRRGLRAGLSMGDGYIKVMRLRREVEHTERFDRGEESDGFHFDHQWMVRGHWRRQHYKSLGPARLPDGSFNRESHRLVWIDSHLSGNPFGPLVIGHNVTAAVR